MHPRVIAQRSQNAQNRAVAAAQELAAAHGLEATLAAALSVYERDPETRLVLRQEAVADLLEALNGARKETTTMSNTETERLQATCDDMHAEIADLRDRLKKAEDSAAPHPKRGPGRPPKHATA